MLDTLDRIEPKLDGALVSPSAWSRVRALGAMLPPEMINGIYLECRLAAGATAVDVVVRVPRDGADILAGTNPAIAIDAAYVNQPAWDAVRALAREWSDPATVVERVVDHLWLEFDLDSAEMSTNGHPAPAPSVFVAFNHAAIAPLSRNVLARTIRRVLAPLGGEMLPARTWRSLRRALDAMPAGTAVPYVGLMLARGGGGLRLYAARVRDDAWPGLLRAAAWPGCARSLRESLDALRDAAPYGIGMGHIDIGEETSPRIGFEYTFDRRAQLRGSLRESPLLAALVACGLCAPDKEAALHRWSGHERVVLPHELWDSLLVRRVNCVKVVSMGAGIIEAKGYLLTFNRPLGAWVQ